jgi:hypothetical protein
MPRLCSTEPSQRASITTGSRALTRIRLDVPGMARISMDVSIQLLASCALLSFGLGFHGSASKKLGPLLALAQPPSCQGSVPISSVIVIGALRELPTGLSESSPFRTLCDTQLRSAMLDSPRPRPHLNFFRLQTIHVAVIRRPSLSDYLTRARCQACTGTTDCRGAGALLRVLPPPIPSSSVSLRNISTQCVSCILPLTVHRPCGFPPKDSPLHLLRSYTDQ